MSLPLSVRWRLEKRLWDNLQNPLGQTAQRVHEYFRSRQFTVLNDQHENYPFLQNPCVTVRDNYDALLFPPNHPGRSPSDTFYLVSPTSNPAVTSSNDLALGFQPILPVHQKPETPLLRTHGTAHLPKVLSQGIGRGVWTVDVFRKDELNATHSPVFHQTDGLYLWESNEAVDCIKLERIVDHLKTTLSELIPLVLGRNVSQRWSNDSFPFTHPSFQLEVFGANVRLPQTKGVHLTEENWMEVLGCGVLKPELLSRAQKPNAAGWAFGLGLERLTMLAYQIPDVRLLWNEDPQFTAQFKDGQIRCYKPISRQPPTVRDLSVWFPVSGGSLSSEQITHLTQLLTEVAREEANDYIAEISVRDRYQNGAYESVGWRLVYQALNFTLTNEQVNKLQRTIIQRLRSEYNWDTRGG